MKKGWISGIILLAATSVFSQPKIDSLLRLTEKASEKEKIGVYLTLSEKLRNDTAKSNSFAREAYALAVKYKQPANEAKAWYMLGETNYYARDFASAISQYQKAIPLYTEIGDSIDIYNCYNSIGLCHHFLFQGESAIENYFRAMKYCENDPERTADIFSNIGMTHTKMNNFDAAIENYRKSLQINLSIKDSGSIAVNYNGLGDVFANSERPDSAIVNFRKAYHYFTRLKQYTRQAITISNLATAYASFPDSLEKSLDYFNQAWKKFQDLGWNHYEPEIRQGIGSVYYTQGKYLMAIAEFDKSLQLTDKFNRGFNLKKLNYESLSQAYEKIGNYKKALENYRLFKVYTDSMDQKEKFQQILSLEKQYETEKKENKIIKLQAKQQLTDVQLRKNKQLKQLAFITTMLLLMFIFFILIKYFDKIKLNQILETKNRKIEESEKELRLINASKNKFFSIIAHDLKNPFHTIMGYSWLLNKEYERFSEAERRKFAFDIHESSNNIFRLLQNLLDWSKTQTGGLKFAPIDVEFKRILDNSLNVMKSMAD